MPHSGAVSASCVLEDGAHVVSDYDMQVLVILGVVCGRTRREISFHWDGRFHIYPLTMETVDMGASSYDVSTSWFARTALDRQEGFLSD